MQAEQKLQFEPGGSGQLFLSLAEELKLPLQHIARHAELGLLVGDEPADTLAHIRTSAVASLQLIDSYLLSVRLAQAPKEQFALEPVSVAAVLHDARNRLSQLAQARGVMLELHVDGKYGPVLAHEAALKTALVSLGYSLLEGVKAHGSDRQLTLRLAAHKTKYGIVAGLYCDAWDLTPKVLRTAQKLHGTVRQPAVDLLPGSGAGMFVADAILQAMSSRLRVGRYQKAAGIAVTLPLSPQLRLV